MVTSALRLWLRMCASASMVIAFHLPRTLSLSFGRLPEGNTTLTVSPSGLAITLRLGMKVIYDRETDTLTIVLSDVPVAESDEDKPGAILDL